MKTKKNPGKTLRKSGKSQGKIREFDGIKKVGTLYLLCDETRCMVFSYMWVYSKDDTMAHTCRLVVTS